MMSVLKNQFFMLYHGAFTLLLIYFSLLEFSSAKRDFRVISLNAWHYGTRVDNGYAKIARILDKLKPKIVLLQETDANLVDYLIKSSKKEWHLCSGRNAAYYAYKGPVILSRFPVHEEYHQSTVIAWNKRPYNVGCSFRIPDTQEKYVNIWNVQLDPQSYGPYRACGILNDICGVRVNESIEVILYACEKNRTAELKTLIASSAFQSALWSTDAPLILGGDFASPSHLDWTKSARDSHCNLAFEWPLSSFLSRVYKFKDSYRKQNRKVDPAKDATWSPVFKTTSWLHPGLNTPEPQDRIDFIYYRGSKIKPVDSHMVFPTGLCQYPYVRSNEYPSDHGVMVTDFVVK